MLEREQHIDRFVWLMCGKCIHRLVYARNISGKAIRRHCSGWVGGVLFLAILCLRYLLEGEGGERDRDRECAHCVILDGERELPWAWAPPSSLQMLGL